MHCVYCFGQNPGAREKHLAIQLLRAITLLLIKSVSPIYLVDEFHFLFLLFLPLRPSQQREGWRNLVCVEFLQMIKQMVVGFCWGLMLLWTLGVHFESTCTVKEVKGLQDCSKTLEMGI